MTRARALLRPATLLIVTLLTGCDNVEWGGIEVAVVPPPSGRGAVVVEEPEERGVERVPEGPILYYARRTEGGGVLIPVGAVAGDTLAPLRPVEDPEAYARQFIARHLRQGTEFALFRNGVRLGTFVVQSAGLPEGGACPGVPQALGEMELSADAENTLEFLAVSKTSAPVSRMRGTPPPTPDRRMQLLGPILAERLLRARGAQLPGNWARAMAQIKPVPLDDRPDMAFTATLLVDDTLGPGLDTTGYSLFFVAQPVSQVGYDTAYARFTPYPERGKQAPRAVDFLDWDRDGEMEVLLQVYGTQDTWFEAVGRIDDRWTRIFMGRCPRPATTPTADTTAAAPAAGAAAGTAATTATPRAARPVNPPARSTTGGAAPAPRLLGRPVTTAPGTQERAGPPAETARPDTIGRPGAA